MNINFIEPSYQIMSVTPDVISLMELVGRNAYKSESKITPESATTFLRMIIKKGHHGILEHGSITIRFICSRTIANELVRHRIASYVQLSQRYVDYTKKESINVVLPLGLTETQTETFKLSVEQSIIDYFDLIKQGVKPQVAREVLPNGFYTDIIATFNFRSLRNMLSLRCDESAHPEIRRLMKPLLDDLFQQYPVLFEDIIGRKK